jgi:hypothetical protein
LYYPFVIKDFRGNWTQSWIYSDGEASVMKVGFETIVGYIPEEVLTKEHFDYLSPSGIGRKALAFRRRL